MDLTPFKVQYEYNGQRAEAEIRPCCREDNVVDYAICKNEKLAFTITKVRTEPNHYWVIAVKNADDLIDNDLVQLLGNAIDRHIPADRMDR
jgi:hypothetical protein